ncbi:MAG: bifunctional transaldolase/phosoglucose isomerase [Candidatus Dormibacteraeota bacterium]|nr:bifunctional transaldolase/phosoglucose isomerase [Candidatus Dormibacteraeota bacterium]
MPNPLQQLGAHGQSIWLDFISRELVTTGELERKINEDNVTGLTSNPTIFQKAIAEGTDYDQQIKEVVAAGVTDPHEIFLSLAISDIQHACDILRPIYERTAGSDGFASLEVAPDVAHDTEGAISQARALWERVDRPNVMIKIPATDEGIPAIAACLNSGQNINITLIFALQMYDRVIDQYMNALWARHERGEPLDIHSVASFFVSRVDTAVDKLLQEKLTDDPGNAVLEGLMGKAAIANARLAYQKFQQRFSEPRFQRLAEAGARVQRPLWASTSAKNPNYRDVVYAEALIGPDTVDTMPPKTIDDFRDHGIVAADTAPEGYEEAARVIEQLREVGIDIDVVTQNLLDAGVETFAVAYHEMIRDLVIKTDRLHGGFIDRQHYALGSSSDALDVAQEPGTETVGMRVWRRDPDLWKPGDGAAAAVVRNRLGWLDVTETMAGRVAELTGLGSEVREAGWTQCVLMGMGGSSLCPEVLRTSFGSAAGQPVLHVLDTTDPVAIAELTRSLDPRHTGFIVSSKSGTTLETLSHFAHFWDLVTSAGIPEPGRHFIAVSDPGTPLTQLGQERSFRRVFQNPEDIGGRYSALSYFGLVPAAVMGIDVAELLGRAHAMRWLCAPRVPADLNPGVLLGTVFGALHGSGRDKVTILAPDRIAAYSLWAEQLIAESTGKEGKGLIPVGSEPIGDPGVYGDDRLFVALRLGDDAVFDPAVGALRQAGLPVITFDLSDLFDLGAEFFRWEFATAVAGAALHIDAFDEPNVQESKDNTKKVLAQYEQTGALPQEQAAVSSGGISIFGDVSGSPGQAINQHLDTAQHGDYVALMAYVTPNAANEAAMQRLRVQIRESRRIATTFGLGPRFLHSTGQLHKGGPNTGVFIQITGDDSEDVAIPGKPFTFSVLKQAQAAGDLQSLRDHGRRVIRIHVAGDLIEGVDHLTNACGAAAVR